MATKSSSAPSTGIFVPNSVSSKIIKFLDLEFGKFEAQAKNCDRYSIIDVKLPVRIIELFLRLLQMYVDNPVLRQNIGSVQLLAKIFLLLRTHYNAYCPCGLDVELDLKDDDEDDDDDDDGWEDCYEMEPLNRFFQNIPHLPIKQMIDAEKAKKKLLKDENYIRNRLMEQNDGYICEICNSKGAKMDDIAAHVKLASHEKNLDIYKRNEIYAAFPNLDIETYGCKACKSEYSTFSSLVKHFEKSQHTDVVNKLLISGTKNISHGVTTKSDNMIAKPMQTETKNVSSSEIKSNGKSTTVAIKDKAKTVTNVETKTTQTFFISNKSEEKNTTNVSKIDTKSANHVSTKSQTKTVINKPEIKPADTKVATIVASKLEMKPSNNDLAKPQTKTTATVVSKPETKPLNKGSTKLQTTTAVASESKPSNKELTRPLPKMITNGPTESKPSTPAEKVPIEVATKPEYNMKFIVSKDSGKYCQVCDRKLLDEATISTHIKASDHLKLKSIFEANQEYVKTSINCDNLLCIMCCDCFCNIHELACHFKGTKHVNLVKASSKSSPAPAKLVHKPVAKNILKSAQLNDTDGKYFRQKANLAQCIVCNVTLNKSGDIIEHINDQQHSQNVLECIKHEEYFQLPGDKLTFNCLKCTSVLNSFADILIHCKDHIASIPKPKPVDAFKLSKNDEKFISKGKTDKSSRCNLCDKELPTEAALISHTSSSNHTKNINLFAKNETYCTSGKTSCSLCKYTSQDLASLVKHFKTDTHQKATVKGKKTQNQTSVHIPSYCKPKLDQMIEIPTAIKSPKLITPKKDKKEETLVRKSRLQLFSLSEANLEELTSYDQFPMKKPDNSYIIAKNDVFYCRICNVDLPAVTVATHMNGATHRINIEVFESLQCHVLTTADCVQCRTCKVTFVHVYELVKHFREKIHTKPVKAEKPKEHESVPPPEFVFGASNNVSVEKVAHDLTPAPVESIENKPIEPPDSPKRVKIAKSDRKHIFRLADTIVMCNLCNTKLVDSESLDSHVNNLNHKRNSIVYQENEPLIKQLDSIGSMFECTACTFTGDLNKVIKHCKKKQHLLAKGCDEVVSDEEIPEENPPDVDLTITEFDLKCISMKNGIIRCNICHSKLTGEKNLLEHMNSDNHRKFAEIYKLNEPFIEQFDEYGYSYKCIVCDVIFTRLDTMIKHFSEEAHFQTAEEIRPQVSIINNTRFNVTTYDFECILCSITFEGFAEFSKHCYSPQHEVLRNSIQSESNEIPYNITITDYVYHCHACNIRLVNKALMEKHQKKRIHDESVVSFKTHVNNAPVIEIVGYEYLCNLCWFPMYSAAELAVHERSNMHKSGKNFDDVWRFNEKHLIMCGNMNKVRCELCLKTIGIEKLIKHCTSRDHRVKFIANHTEESSQDQHIVWRNATQYCTLCDCKLINNHNLVNHVNSEKHKMRLLRY